MNGVFRTLKRRKKCREKSWIIMQGKERRKKKGMQEKKKGMQGKEETENVMQDQRE
jgi:hypothetical protein